MKTWKQGFIGVLAIIALALTFTACKDEPKKDPCSCTVKVHYDTPCDCVGVGNDCNCTVYYKPAFADIFTLHESIITPPPNYTIHPEAPDKIITLFNTILDEIWVTDPLLLLDLADKKGTIQIYYTVNSDSLSISAYIAGTENYAGGYLLLVGNYFAEDGYYPPALSVNFTDQLKAALIEARDDGEWANAND